MTLLNQPRDTKMTKLAEKNKQLMVEVLDNSKSWAINPYGNYVNTTGYKVVFHDNSFRVERKTKLGTWFRVNGGYYKDVTVIDGCIHHCGKRTGIC
jgi:hypothetical protein